jgi:hypothetical protein
MNVMWSRVAPYLVKAAFMFEPIAPPFISLFVKRPLGAWKKQGKLDQYRVGTTRLEKYHYYIDVDIELTPEQTRTATQRALHRLVTALRR